MEFTVDERVWTSASLSPDAGLLAGLYASGPVLVWSVETGRLLPNWPQNIDVTGMDAPATTNLVSVDRQTFRSLDASRIIFEPQVVWSPDGSWLATAAREREVIWEVASGSGKLLGKSNAVALAWSPDGRLMAAVEYPGTLRIWEVSTGAELLARFGLQAGPTQLDWSVTGDELALNESDGTLLRWRIPEEVIGSR
jgi:WD40 repeat protein